jgi:hypothetical protein
MAHNWKTFTEEQVRDLRKSPWVKSATSKMIRFTAAFKAEFWRQYKEDGKTPRQIVAALGFDPDMLGESRVAGIMLHIREEAVTGDFSDVRRTYTLNDENAAPSKMLLKMQHEVAYLRQEVEFIKKTILAERKAGPWK